MNYSGRKIWVKMNQGWVNLWTTSSGEKRQCRVLGNKNEYLLVEVPHFLEGPRRTPLTLHRYEAMKKEGFHFLPWPEIELSLYGTCWVSETGGWVKEPCKQCFRLTK